MSGRLAAVAAILVVSAGFAGCIETLSFLSSSDEVTAQENRDLADAAAAAWAPDAQLVAVAAFENANATPMFPSDPEVGNGRAPVWFYAYSAENGTKGRAFQVSANGEVLAVNESDEVDAADMAKVGADPIGSWVIDSDRAVEIARANESFESVASLEGASVIEALGSEDGLTVWAVIAATQTGQAMAIIDAVNGTLIEAQAFTMDFSMPAIPGMPSGPTTGPQVELQESGSLANEAEIEYEFEVAYADSGSIELSFSKQLPTDGMEWEIVDEAGELIADGEYQSLTGLSDGGSDTFEIENPGTYRLVLRHDPEQMIPIGQVDYDVHLVVGVPCGGTPSAPSGSPPAVPMPCPSSG